jgi:hypothetical protein
MQNRMDTDDHFVPVIKSQPVTITKPNGIHKTGMQQNPISHPTIACRLDWFGAAAFAFQIAQTLNSAQSAVTQRLIITEATLWHSSSALTMQPYSPVNA